MDAKFAAQRIELNNALSKLSEKKDLESGIQVAISVLEFLHISAFPEIDDVIDSQLLKLPNSERQDPWFQQHPWMRGERAAFELLDAEEVHVQAKFYWLKKKGKAFVAGAVHFTKNWEDHNFTRTDDFKIGIDFFLTPDGESVSVVLSNRGKLRVLELQKRLTNTQVEIFEKWFATPLGASRSQLHENLWQSFRLQSVNAHFYGGVADAFNELVASLESQGRDVESAKLFTSRLLGRLIFLWFLRKMDLVSTREDYFEPQINNSENYYHNKLEVLFFGVLNTPIESRTSHSGSVDLETPYLNGGLFSPHADDWVGDRTLRFPDNFFKKLFEHFSEFNFTTDESTPEFEQVAIDPEMLGRVFESLLASQIEITGELGRKAKGAYYTPRAVVAYMVKESIRSYLVNAIGEDERGQTAVQKLLDTSDQDWAIAGSNSLRDISPELRARIAILLQNIRTIDPACGSGAFPLGLLQMLTKLQMRLDPRLDIYKTKLSILQNNIFGVDIEPMAVEISRLRSWLSLIVEEGGAKAVQPLPNLDFNFVAANSLLPLEGEGLLSDSEFSEKLSQIRNEYFAATSPLRKSKLQAQYIELIRPDLFDDFDERAAQLKSFNPFSQQSVASFFDAQHMFGLSEGFDLVVGNPPYLGEKGHGEIFGPVRKSLLGRRFYVGKMDYFYFFFHLGLDLLREGGSLCFITTNYYLTATYANKLRDDIVKRASVTSLLNFSDLKIFESAAGQHNLVTLLVKGDLKRDAKTLIARTDKPVKASDDFLEAIFSEDPDSVSVQWIPQVEIASNNQFRLTNSGSHDIEGVLDVLAGSQQVVGLHFNVLTGAQTQADKVSRAHARKFGLPESEIGKGIFVLSGQELQDLNLDEHELGIVKPWFKNSDIRRYEANQDNSEFVVFADKRTRSLETRPTLLKHLNKFRQIIDAASSNSPYMHRPRSIDFDAPKLVTPYKTPGVRFAMAEGPWYASGDVYFITEKTRAMTLWSLLGILNSDLLNTWYWLRGKRKGNLIEMYEEPLSATPLPPIDLSNSQKVAEIGELAKAISTQGKSLPKEELGRLEALINAKVCELYGLSGEQVAVLEEWSSSWSNDPLRVD